MTDKIRDFTDQMLRNLQNQVRENYMVGQTSLFQRVFWHPLSHRPIKRVPKDAVKYILLTSEKHYSNTDDIVRLKINSKSLEFISAAVGAKLVTLEANELVLTEDGEEWLRSRSPIRSQISMLIDDIRKNKVAIVLSVMSGLATVWAFCKVVYELGKAFGIF